MEEIERTSYRAYLEEEDLEAFSAAGWIEPY